MVGIKLMIPFPSGELGKLASLGKLAMEARELGKLASLEARKLGLPFHFVVYGFFMTNEK